MPATLDPQPNAMDFAFVKPTWPFPPAGTLRFFANQNTGALNVEDSSGNLTAVGTSAAFPAFGQYYFYISAGTVFAKNLKTGAIDFQGSDAAIVINSAMAGSAATGALLFFANGIYNLNSVTLDSITGIRYCIGIPPTGAATQVQWFFVGESACQPLYASLQTNGVIFNLTTAAETAAGAGNFISAFYQQASASWGNINNNVIFLRNVAARIPSNQRGNECLFDFTNTLQCDLYNVNADTTVVAGGQLGTGLSAPAASVIGYRTNKTQTDECRLIYCWAIGMETGYEVDTEHSFLMDCHSSFCKFAAKYNAGNLVHPSLWWHFQDIHCINGIQIGTVAGARLDLVNHDVEFLTAGQSATWGRVSNQTESPAGNCSGHVWSTSVQGNVGIANNGNFFSAGGQNFRVEQSEKMYPAGLLVSAVTSVATSGTTKQTLQSFTIAAGAQAGQGTLFWNNTGAILRVKAWGFTAANGNSKVVEIDFGGVTVATITTSANNAAVELEADILCTANNAQDVIAKCYDGTQSLVQRSSQTVTSNTSIALAVAATTATQAGDFTFRGWIAEVIATY
jgi:hypothetical protein